MRAFYRALAVFLCLSISVGCGGAAFAQEEALDVSTVENLTTEERMQWQEWSVEQNVADMSAAANAIPMTDEEKAMLDGLSASLDESFHLDDVDLSDLSKNERLPNTVFNILLLGVDNRSMELERGRSDAVIICSVNLVTGGLTLTSVSRDTAVTITGRKMTRINNAYKYGGAQLSMETVNINYQMNIDRYVVVNIHGLSAIIDALGGLDMEMTALEASRLNYELIKEPMDDVKRERAKRQDGVQHLDGMQAVTFARIRNIDSDLERTRRQRQLLETLLEKVMKDMSVSKLMSLIETALPYGDTNLTIDELLTLGTTVMNGDAMQKMKDGQPMMEQLRIPINKHYSWKKFGEAALLYINEANLKYTVDTLHTLLYGKSYYQAP